MDGSGINGSDFKCYMLEDYTTGQGGYFNTIPAPFQGDTGKLVTRTYQMLFRVCPSFY
jgi:hypothetical protein